MQTNNHNNTDMKRIIAMIWMVVLFTTKPKPAKRIPANHVDILLLGQYFCICLHSKIPWNHIDKSIRQAPNYTNHSHTHKLTHIFIHKNQHKTYDTDMYRFAHTNM